MKKRTKILIGVSLAVFTCLVFLFFNGFHLMGIEDHYGDLQNVYYKSESGDIIIDNKGRVGFIKKISNRIYVTENDCMKDLYNWADGKSDLNFNVYRSVALETLTADPTYDDILTIVKSQNLKPIISY